MMRSARSGTTSQAIFSMMSRDMREISEASCSSLRESSPAAGGVPVTDAASATGTYSSSGANWSSNSWAIGGGGVVIEGDAATAGSASSAKNSSASVGGTAKAGAASSAKTSNCSSGTVSNPAASASSSKMANCSPGGASNPASSSKISN